MAIPVNTSTTVTTAGTRVQLTASAISAPYVIFQAPAANTNPIFIGLSDVASTKYMVRLAAGSVFVLEGTTTNRGLGGEIELNSLYVDATTNGDKLFWTYVPRT